MFFIHPIIHKPSDVKIAMKIEYLRSHFIPLLRQTNYKPLSASTNDFPTYSLIRISYDI